MPNVGKSIGNAVLGTLGRIMARTQENRPLPVDLLESETAYLAIFDASGALASDLHVRFEEQTISVRLDRFRNNRDEFQLLFPGRGVALQGEVSLPADATVDPVEATATLKDNGTLHVRIPKMEAVTDGEDSTVSETQND